MPRPAPRHDRDAGGPADVLAAKAALRQEVWAAMREARVARFPGAAGRIPNFTGAEAAAERLRAMAVWQAAGTVKANPDSAQWPVRQRALEDGKIVYMAVPRLAEPEPFFALDPAHLSEPPRKAASIGPHTMAVTTVHELQVYPAGAIPLTGHDVPLDFIITPERVIDCRPGHGPRRAAGICWDDLTEEKIAAIPLLSALRAGS